MAGNYYRNPKSTCIAHTSFTAVAKTVQSGRRKIAGGSRGIVTVTFRRDRRTYTLSTPLAYNFWRAFVNAGSKGRFWNYQMRGRF